MSVQQGGHDTLEGLGGSAFPRGAVTAIHLSLHMVQDICQSVLNYSSPTHVTHLRGCKQTRCKNKLKGLRDLGETCMAILTGWYLMSLGVYLKCGPKFTDTYNRRKKHKAY